MTIAQAARALRELLAERPDLAVSRVTEHDLEWLASLDFDAIQWAQEMSIEEHEALVSDYIKAEQEALHKQQANASAIADGGWPTYPSEY